MKKLTLTLGIIALSAVSFGQKSNITNAALEYKKLKPMLYAGQDIQGAKKSVVLAKGYIDDAAAHPDTKESQKMFLYKGEIYFALSMVLEMDSSLATISADDALDACLMAWKKGVNLGKKYKFAIKEAANEKRSLAYLVAETMWKEENSILIGRKQKYTELTDKYCDDPKNEDNEEESESSMSYD